MPIASPGYAIREDVFTGAEMSSVLAALTATEISRTKAGARHVLSVPAVRAVANDPRLLSIAEEFVGPAAAPFRATLFDKSPAANWLVAWHQDTALPLRERIDDPDCGTWSTKVAWFTRTRRRGHSLSSSPCA